MYCTKYDPNTWVYCTKICTVHSYVLYGITVQLCVLNTWVYCTVQRHVLYKGAHSTIVCVCVCVYSTVMNLTFDVQIEKCTGEKPFYLVKICLQDKGVFWTIINLANQFVIKLIYFWKIICFFINCDFSFAGGLFYFVLKWFDIRK